MSKTKKIFVFTLSAVMVLFFLQSAHAGLATTVKTQESIAIQSPTMDSIGTGSSGSYTHGAGKSEGSKTKAYSKEGHGHSPHKKSEGSGSKSYSGHHGSKSGHINHADSAKHKKHHYSKNSHKNHDKHSGHSAHSSKCFFSHLLNFRDKLQLSETQVEDIQKMRFEYQKNYVMLKAEKEVAKMEFDRLVHGKTVDESAIRAAGEKIIVAKTKKIRLKVEAKIAVMKLLTDEQRNKVHTMHSSH
ncbi:MAG: Spy/CpxP family protein refolding chaperone [Nitrospinae bacterium]|nr:Spy/CpxP family protein refolding chaperone [Nitrospinota bacterium]